MTTNNGSKTSGTIDYLYNLDLFLNPEIVNKFRGIKYVCMQGSSDRAKFLAQKLAKLILNIDEQYFTPINLFRASRFECYRIGNILSVSHGMGTVSVMNLLNDVTKLMRAAGNTNLEYIRIGTCGGLNVDPGSVIITDTSYQPDLTQGYKMTILGKNVVFPTNMDSKLNDRILAAQPEKLKFNLYRGNSIAADDFYLGQARFDGAIKPKYDETQRREYFNRVIAHNIYNFEMESTALAAFCNRAKISATMIAVTIINRLQGDQVIASEDELIEFSNRSQ
ncbi:MAG: hypothetical protein K2X63_06640, partial [Burkholderiaceae bacterium]|nr:hypothetical protein [Burkholderiaceae bacterium]